MSTYIVHFTINPLMHNKVNSRAVIPYMQPITDIFSITIYRNLLLIHYLGYRQRNQFLRKMIWPVVIGTTSNIYWKIEGFMISTN
ncbi:hypothetical protein D3C87_1750240 [compost metagenome]